MTRAAIQLYSLRGMDEPLPTVLRRVADAGYDGVEFAKRIHDADVDEVARALDETGLTPIAGHASLEQLENDTEDVLERYEALGVDTAIVPHLSPSQFWTRERVDATANRLHGVATELADRGFTFRYHNGIVDVMPLFDGLGVDRLVGRGPVPDGAWTVAAHGLGALWHPDPLSDRTGFGRLLSQTDPDLVPLELDVGGVAAAGHDAADVVRRVADRSEYVHVSDVRRSGKLPHQFASTPPGEGRLDLGAVGAAAVDAGVEWLVYEDEHSSDPEAVLEGGVRALSPFVTEGALVDRTLERWRGAVGAEEA